MTLKILALLCAIPALSYAAVFQYGGIKHDITNQTSTVSPIIISAASTQVQRVTGSTNQVMKLPDATTLRSGYWYIAQSESSGTLTVSTSSSTPVAVVAAATQTSPKGGLFYLTSNATTGGPWTYIPFGASSGGSTVYSWIGNHGSDCSWSKVAAGYANPAAGDASCTFTEVRNNGMGTVTSYNTGTPGTNYPGIVLSPPAVGEYMVCAVLKQATHTQVQNFGVQLYDGTTVISQQYGTTATTGDNFAFGMTFCGLWYASSTGSATLRLEFNNFGGAGSQDNFGNVWWSIFKVN